MVLISMPFQMGVVIFIFAYVGIWLDEKYPNPDNLYTKILTLFGVFIAMYQVIRQVNQLNDKK